MVKNVKFCTFFKIYCTVKFQHSVLIRSVTYMQLLV